MSKYQYLYMKIGGEFSEWENFGVEWGRDYLGIILFLVQGFTAFAIYAFQITVSAESSPSLLARFSRTVAAHTANLLICVVQNN